MVKPQESNRRFFDRAKHLRKSERTRANILDAAARVIARDGVDGASVNEIAREAELANGTIYLHFKDKDDVALAVSLAIAEELTRQLDEALSGIDDAAERNSWATRQFIDMAVRDASWGWTFYRALWALPDLRSRVASFLRADLLLGFERGDFTVPVDDLLIDVFLSMISAALFARLSGTGGAEAGSRVSELQLRMLGVEPERARDLAWRELKPFDA